MFNNVADGFQQKPVSGFGTLSQGGFGESKSKAFGLGTGFNTNAGVFLHNNVLCVSTV